MPNFLVRLITCFVLSASLAGCGMYTPSKNPLVSDEPIAGVSSDQGDFENRLVNHIQCELAIGFEEAHKLDVPWLDDWGVTITHSVTVEDQSGVSPGVTFIQPVHSSVIPFAQYASQSIGVSGSANALRTETIQYTFRNSDIEKDVQVNKCFDFKNEPFIEGDLKIREFIFDHAEVANARNAGLSAKYSYSPIFNAFTEEITFVAAFGGNLTPTWKLARFTANTSSNLLVSERTNTNDLVITIGPLATSQPLSPGHPRPPANGPLQLTDAAMNQHFARVQASAIAVSSQGQTH